MRAPDAAPPGPLLARPLAGAHAALREALAPRWSERQPRAALAGLVAIAAILAGARLAGLPPLWGLVAAGGAFSVGFGAFQSLPGRPAAPMTLAALGMTAAAGIGTLAGASPLLAVAAAAVGGFALGLATAFGNALWWVALQVAIALVLAGSFPADPGHAALRAGLVGLGALLQRLAAPPLWRLAGLTPGSLTPPGAVPAPAGAAAWADARRRALDPAGPWLGHAATLALAAGAATALYRALDLENGFWLPMTVLIVLRPARRDTLLRAIARVLGTIAGAGLATLLVALLQPPEPMLIAVILLLAGGCYALQWVNFALLSLCITGYVALLMALTGAPEPQVALDRMLATALGGAIALLAHLVRPGPRPASPAR